MAGTGDPSEDTAEVTLVNASEVASSWANVGTQLDGIGHQYAALKATGVSFPEKVTSAMFGLGQGCTSVGAQWTTAAGDVQKQHDEVDTPKAADYKTTTEAVKKAKESAAQGLMIAAMGGSSAYMESAQASLAAERAKRQTVLDTAVSETSTRIQPLPGHARLAGEAVTTARGTMVTQSGGQPMPADVQQIVPPKSVPTGSPSGGPNAKPTSTSPSGGKPSDTKPSDNKSQVDDKGAGGDPAANKPQQQNPQGQQPQAQQPQGGQPQQGAQPAGGAPAQGNRPGATVPINQPTGIPVGRDGKSDPSVRQTPSNPAVNPNGKYAGRELGSGAGQGTKPSPTAPLGSGNSATGAGSGKGGAAAPASSASGTGSGARPMGGGMMGGAGHGGAGGQGGGAARPKGEVKSHDKRLTAEDVAEQALGGVVRDGDDGKPVPPPVPGSNGGAPVPSPPVKP